MTNKFFILHKEADFDDSGSTEIINDFSNSYLKEIQSISMFSWNTAAKTVKTGAYFSKKELRRALWIISVYGSYLIYREPILSRALTASMLFYYILYIEDETSFRKVCLLTMGLDLRKFYVDCSTSFCLNYHAHTGQQIENFEGFVIPYVSRFTKTRLCS